VLTVKAEGRAPFTGDLRSDEGKAAFAAWLTDFLDRDDHRGLLKVLTAPPHRFTDNPQGFISVVNLESVRDLETRLGTAATTLVKFIRRCVATHVNPETGERDIEILAALRDFYGHLYCGVYLKVSASACVNEGDPAELLN